MDNEFAELIAKYENTIPYEKFIETLNKCKEICDIRIDLYNTKNNDNKIIKKCIERLQKYKNKSEELKKIEKNIIVNSKNNRFESAGYNENYSIYYSIRYKNKEFKFGYNYDGDNEGQGDYSFDFNGINVIEQNIFCGEDNITQIKKILNLKNTTEKQLLEFLFVVCDCEFLMSKCVDDFIE